MDSVLGLQRLLKYLIILTQPAILKTFFKFNERVKHNVKNNAAKIN